MAFEGDQPVVPMEGQRMGTRKIPVRTPLGDLCCYLSVYFNKYLLSTYCVPGAGDTAVTRVGAMLALMKLAFW